MSDPAIRPADERFWQRQQQRRQELGQPCCSLAKMSEALFELAGDLAVVIHGERDCLSSFHHRAGRGCASFFSTQLGDRQLIAGDTAAPLQELLRLIAAERRPEAVLVLGTCPLEMIGDPFEAVVERIAGETGIPMVALRTSGLGPLTLSQQQCLDWLYATLAGLAPAGAEATGAAADKVNLIGLPARADLAELQQVAAELGLSLNGIYPQWQTGLESWRRIGAAARSLVVDRSRYPRLTARLEAFGQRVIEVPAPIGATQSRRLYQLLAGAAGAADLERIVAPLAAAHQPARDRVAARAAGRRLALCIRMLKSESSCKLAYEGLADLEMLRELGFEVVVMVQGPPEQSARRSYAERLEELGFGDVPCRVFVGTWKLGEALREADIDIAVASDAARAIVAEAGVRLIASGSFQPFFSGIGQNLELISRVLDEEP